VLVVWEWFWHKRIDEFEHDPRLCVSITGDTAEQLEATRQRWLATALAQLKERGILTPRECFAVGESVVFARWMLGRGKD
jgi:hypothetical protein